MIDFRLMDSQDGAILRIPAGSWEHCRRFDREYQARNLEGVDVLIAFAPSVPNPDLAPDPSSFGRIKSV
jgi:hypothetical protein